MRQSKGLISALSLLVILVLIGIGVQGQGKEAISAGFGVTISPSWTQLNYIYPLNDDLFLHLFAGVEGYSGMLFGTDVVDHHFLGLTLGWQPAWTGWEILPGVTLFRISPLETGIMLFQESQDGEAGLINWYPVFKYGLALMTIEFEIKLDL
jgi:hypothetical protein